jgi:hypothetical protein
MEGLHVLLCDSFNRYKTHVRAADGFADGSRIMGIRLVPGPIGLHLLGAHQAHLVPQFAPLAPPIMRSASCLPADQTPGEIGQKRSKLRTAEFFLEHNVPVGIDTMQLKHVLGQINTECLDCHLASLPRLFIMRTSSLPL